AGLQREDADPRKLRILEARPADVARLDLQHDAMPGTQGRRRLGEVPAVRLRRRQSLRIPEDAGEPERTDLQRLVARVRGPPGGGANRRGAADPRGGGRRREDHAPPAGSRTASKIFW